MTIRARPDVRLLDNAAWHALGARHDRFAQSYGRARRYRGDVARYSALPDGPDAGAWRDLATLAGPGGEVVLTGAPVPRPPGWTVVRTGRAVQFVAENLSGAIDPEAVRLGQADVPEIFDLIRRTRPGPWLRRTVELGTYVGLRHRGRLVALAGERVQPPGWTEVSAVCTDEAFRGRGLATRLVGAVVHGISARGEAAFLHAAVENGTAIRLYEQLGFRIRRETELAVLRAPTP